MRPGVQVRDLVIGTGVEAVRGKTVVTKFRRNRHE